MAKRRGTSGSREVGADTQKTLGIEIPQASSADPEVRSSSRTAVEGAVDNSDTARGTDQDPITTESEFSSLGDEYGLQALYGNAWKTYAGDSAWLDDAVTRARLYRLVYPAGPPRGLARQVKDSFQADGLRQLQERHGITQEQLDSAFAREASPQGGATLEDGVRDTDAAMSDANDLVQSYQQARNSFEEYLGQLEANGRDDLASALRAEADSLGYYDQDGNTDIAQLQEAINGFDALLERVSENTPPPPADRDLPPQDMADEFDPDEADAADNLEDEVDDVVEDTEAAEEIDQTPDEQAAEEAKRNQPPPDEPSPPPPPRNPRDAINEMNKRGRLSSYLPFMNPYVTYPFRRVGGRIKGAYQSVPQDVRQNAYDAIAGTAMAGGLAYGFFGGGNDEADAPLPTESEQQEIDLIMQRLNNRRQAAAPMQQTQPVTAPMQQTQPMTVPMQQAAPMPMTPQPLPAPQQPAGLQQLFNDFNRKYQIR